MFGCNRKYNFPEIAFLLTIIFPFDSEMNLRSHFHFNSFPGHSHAQQHREKREAKHKTNAHTAIQRASIHAQQHREKERTSSDPHFISPIHSDPRTREVRSTHSNTGRNRERASIQSDPRTRELRSKTFYLIPVCVLIKKKGLKKEEVKLEHIPCPINDLTNCHKHKV